MAEKPAATLDVVEKVLPASRATTLRKLFSASAVVTVAACNGGADSPLLRGTTTSAPTSSSPTPSPSPSPTPTSATAEGVYQGTTSSGFTFDALVLEDGSTWAMYGASANGGLLVDGVFNGSGSSNAGTYTATTTDFVAPGTSPVSGTLTANYVAGSSLTGTLREGGQSITLTGTVPVATLYNYDTPAVLSTVTGAWSGGLLDGESATITVTASGAITGQSSGGCSFGGTIAPRPSGKNVFNVSLLFGASPCVAAGQSASGVAVTYPLGTGQTQLVAGLANAGETLGTAFFAQR